jgi:hypothetical protein
MNPMDILSQVTQLAQQVTQGSGQCGQGGGQDDPLQAFMKILQPLLQQAQGPEQGQG